MCDACRREYDDPADRRFHAQPNACPDCGPRARLWRGGPAQAGGDAVAEAAALLRAGAIVAVKGVGGYHLACRAGDADAVARLRARKHREEKPFALMAPDLAAARALVALGDEEVALLTSPARPIVLARRRAGADVAPAVAPGARELGVMLPYAPLHHLLLADAGAPLVLTSGNVSDEPIAFRDDDALRRLGPLADAVLLHDRPIHTRTDDSVARVVRGRPALLRRSRGLVPSAQALPVACRAPVLACGAELKSTFCLAKGPRAWVGHHIGDLRNAETLTAFREGIAHFERLFDVVPEVVAHDLHPDYLSTAYALDREGVELVAVQHHHAHLAACLAEHGLEGPAVGAIYDGTGLGPDGTAWGGEVLVGDLRSFRRAAHLSPARLPGGDRAAREPWRMACAWLVAAGTGASEVPATLRDAVGGGPVGLRGPAGRDGLRGAGHDERGPALRRRRRALRAAGRHELRGAGGDRARGRRRRHRGLVLRAGARPRRAGARPRRPRGRPRGRRGARRRRPASTGLSRTPPRAPAPPRRRTPGSTSSSSRAASSRTGCC